MGGKVEQIVLNIKDKVAEYVKEATEEPIKTTLILCGVVVLISKMIPERHNHHVYVHIK